MKSNDFVIKKSTLKNLNIQTKGEDAEQMRSREEVTIKWQHKGNGTVLSWLWWQLNESILALKFTKVKKKKKQ